MKEITQISLNRTNRTPVYGGFSVNAVYTFTHVKNNLMNIYEVEVEIRGLNEAQPYLEWSRANVIKRYNNNEETLTDEALFDLIEESV